jgi:peptide/nickel transport system substrate-binding protein
MKRLIPIFLAILLLGTLIALSCAPESVSTTPAAPATTTTSTTVRPTQIPTSTTTAPSTTSVPAIDKSKYGGTLRMIEKQPPFANLGMPPMQDDYVGTYATWPILERWVRSYEDASWEPWLAEQVTIAKDLTSITLKIRLGVKFHDGTKLDADAAKWNLDFALQSGRFPFMKDIVKLDDMTVRMGLNFYDNTITQSLATMSAISPTAVKKNGEEWAKWNPVGTGPFIFKSYERDVKLTMVRNPEYWIPGLPYLDAIEWIYIPDDMTRTAAFMHGEAQVVRASAMDAQKLISMGFELIRQPSYMPSRSVIEPDSLNPNSPFYNQKVREAVWISINRDAIIKARGFGLSKTCNQFAGPGQPGYIAELETLRPYDPAKARQLLAEAGYPKGFKATLYPNPGGVTDPDTMVAIQGYLKDIGITLEIVNLDNAAHNNLRYNTGWKNGMIAISQSTSPNIATVFKTFMSDSSITKHTVYTSKEFNDAMYAALATMQVDAKLMEKANRLAWEGAFTIPYQYQPTAGRLNIKTKEVQDFGLNTMYNWQGYTPEKTWLIKSK